MAKITKKGRYYYTQAYIGLDILTGKRKYKRFKATSRDELKYLIAQAKLNKPSSLTDLTIQDIVNKYITAREGSLSVTTIDTYMSYNKGMFPDIANIPVSRLTPPQINTAVAQEMAHLSRHTVQYHAMLVNTAMAFCGLSLRIKVPQKDDNRDYHVPTKNEIDTLLAMARNTPLEIPIYFGATCGLRRGEVCALTYNDIDFDKRTVSVTKTTYRHITKAPKTPSSVRTLDLPNALYNLIKDRYDKGLPLIELTYWGINYRFCRLCKACNLQMRFHDLRHYFASVLLALGVSDRYAITFTGHSSTAVLRNVYQHVFADKRNEVRNQISAFFNENATENTTGNEKSP